MAKYVGETMKKIPLVGGLSTIVDDEDYEWLSQYIWYAHYDFQRGRIYAAHDRPDGKRVYMQDVIVGISALENESWN
ncbi:MAG: hypothetical protein A2167_08650 [Planctomycetes bacterium RBG_13_46_10]|nr:MAG: hypothetical protein A2167_08650 [Planctomycetes bacterium RBG_13_46_10]